MATRPDPVAPQTPEPTAALAQSRGNAVEPAATRTGIIQPRVGGARGFKLDPGLAAARLGPYERQPDEPLYRPLRIFTIDPSVRQSEGGTTIVNVAFERLEPGPVGRLFEVDNRDGASGIAYRRVDLDEHGVLLGSGREASVSDPMFHQQMVYTVCSTVYAAFRRALGRDLAWGFRHETAGRDRLLIRPHAFEGRNAYYDAQRGELAFGYYRADAAVEGAHMASGWVFTCLSHDIIAHEVSHALLDGMRSNFNHPSGPDTLAFHEAFADLVAIFQHFSYKDVVLTAIQRSQGRIGQDDLLLSLALQFGHTTGNKRPLRTAIEAPGSPIKLYDAALPPHELGSVMVSAVFDAFSTVFARKAAPYMRLATGGTGLFQPGAALPYDLQEFLAQVASKLADQFLTICIRAIDYCPPVDMTLGEYLRAMITADHDLVPDDPWAYREALIEAFARRRIYPPGVDILSKDALLWRSPTKPIAAVADLSFAMLRFAGDPCHPADEQETCRQAEALGSLVAAPELMAEFGCAPPGHPDLDGDPVDLPQIHSIRSSRRVGPDGQIVFDLVAELTQLRHARTANGRRFDFYGGATVILGPTGAIRYVIRKSVTAPERLEAQRRFPSSPQGRALWRSKGTSLVPKPDMFRNLHARKTF